MKSSLPQANPDKSLLSHQVNFGQGGFFAVLFIGSRVQALWFRVFILLWPPQFLSSQKPTFSFLLSERFSFLWAKLAVGVVR